MSELINNYSYKKQSFKTDEDIVNYWSGLGFVKDELSNDDKLYLSKLLSKVSDYLLDNNESELLNSYLLPACCRIFYGLKEHNPYKGSLYVIDYEYIIDEIKEKHQEVYTALKSNFKYMDYEAETLQLICSNIKIEIVELYKLKTKDPEKYKILIRDKKLKRII